MSKNYWLTIVAMVIPLGILSVIRDNRRRKEKEKDKELIDKTVEIVFK